MKKGIKIIGVACSSFDRVNDKKVKIVGAIYRGAELLEGVLTSKVAVDGEDATKQIANMIIDSTHYEQIKLVLTRGVTIAGFNYIDLHELHSLTKLPVISIVDREPDMEKIAKALTNLPNGNHRFQVIKKNGYPEPFKSNQTEEPIYVQYSGLKREEIESILNNSTITGRIPEPVRVARIIAIAIS